jgi:sarcosine oxidase gamma subunit
MLVIGLVLLQLLATGYSAVLAGGAAEAGALALAGGGDAHAAVKHALPGWSEARARVDVSGGDVRVRLRPPSPLALVARKLEVGAEAAVELP